MRLNKTKWGIPAFFLHPLAWLWQAAHSIRRFCYRYHLLSKQSFQVPIISVGNLAFGGTGKTPFTLWLANYLADQDKKTMILMRGYKGKLEHSSKLLRSGKLMMLSPMECGDEALLFSRRTKNASIVVGKKRSDNLHHYFDQEKPDVVLLDDGHQHLKLERNLNIVMFNAQMPLKDYRVAPLGLMRESFDALREADVIIISRFDQIGSSTTQKLEALIRSHIYPHVPIILISHVPVAIFDMNFNQHFTIRELKGKRVICVAGIASTVSFFDTVKNLGADVLRCHSFPDHHPFTVEEIGNLLSEADEQDAYILTTEKDIVKMRHIYSSDRILYLEIKVKFLSGEEQIKDIIAKTISA